MRSGSIRLFRTVHQRQSALSAVLIGALTAFSVSVIAQDRGGQAQQKVQIDPRGEDLLIYTDPSNPINDVDDRELTRRLLERMRDATMAPEEIREQRAWQDKQEEALFEQQPVVELTEIITVSTRPGAQPEVIYVTPGRISAMSVIDSTGEPWPIAYAQPGNTANYEVAQVEQHAFKNLLTLQTLYRAGETNLTLMLHELPAVVPLRIRSDGGKYHPSPVIQIDREGPNAKVVSTVGEDQLEDDEIMKEIVVGIPPDGAQKLTSSDRNVEAWTLGDHLYIRTKYTPVAPIGRAYHFGAAGWRAVRMSQTPVLTMSDASGAIKKVFLQEEEF
ncbi:hypothetical protein A3709_19705 [Halioglobus sp. HI00S01]|nr:hypothetical protein A3709_19705 [Halioglobus sp. HI00S01]